MGWWTQGRDIQEQYRWPCRESKPGLNENTNFYSVPVSSYVSSRYGFYYYVEGLEV